MGALGTFLATCCLSAYALSYLMLHDADDVQGPEDWLGVIVALGICASAGALTRRRFALAIAIALGFPMIAMKLLILLNSLFGYRGSGSVLVILLFGALAGAAAFAVVSCHPQTLIIGSLSAVVGLMLVGLVGWVAWETLPQRITELEPATFVTLVAFGPIMGLALGLPFVVVDKKHRGDAESVVSTPPSIR